jgi:hypothetical protein
MRIIAVAFTAALMAGTGLGTALADEQVIHLKQAPGVDKVETSCAICHSLAYIPMNSPYMKQAQWDAEVNKMINAMGAPISAADAQVIKDYLAKNYGG